MAAGVAQGVGRTAALRCELCGAREPVRAAGRIHGWQRCGHCGGIDVMPWSRAEALDGPNARTAVLQLRGRAHFMVPRHTLLTHLEVAAWLFLTFTLGGFLIGVFELEADPHGTWRWLGPLGVGLLMLVLGAILVRAWCVEQHVEISPRRMRAYRTLGSWKHAIAERSLRGRALCVEVRRSTAGDDSLRKRFRVELSPEGDAKRPLALTVRNELEARWVAALAGLAADPSPPGGTRCAGCGAPVDVTMDEHATGTVECPYCDAGFVLAAQRMHWPAVGLPGREDLGARAPDHVRATRRGSELRFELLPRGIVSRVVHAAGLLYGVALFGLLGGFMLFALPHMPEGAIGLRLWGVGAAIAMLGMAGLLCALIALSLFGRDEIVVGEGSVRTASRIGSLRWSRPPPSGPGDARQASTRVPILRLTGVSLERDGSLTRLVLETPNRRLVAGWSLDPAGDRWLKGTILDALEERLRALGREVRRG